MGNSTSALSRRPDPTSSTRPSSTASSSSTLPQRRSWIIGSSPSLPRMSRTPSSGLGRRTFSQSRAAQPLPQAQPTTAPPPVSTIATTSDSHESRGDRSEIGCFSFRNSPSESARRQSLSGVPAPTSATQPGASLTTVPEMSAVPPMADVSPESEAPSTTEASAPPATVGSADDSQIQLIPPVVMESADRLGSNLDASNQESATYAGALPSTADNLAAPQDIPTDSPTETGAFPVTEPEDEETGLPRLVELSDTDSDGAESDGDRPVVETASPLSAVNISSDEAEDVLESYMNPPSDHTQAAPPSSEPSMSNQPAEVPSLIEALAETRPIESAPGIAEDPHGNADIVEPTARGGVDAESTTRPRSRMSLRSGRPSSRASRNSATPTPTGRANGLGPRMGRSGTPVVIIGFRRNGPSPRNGPTNDSAVDDNNQAPAEAERENDSWMVLVISRNSPPRRPLPEANDEAEAPPTEQAATDNVRPETDAATSPTNRPMGPMSGLFSLFLRNAIERAAAAADRTAQTTSPQSASPSSAPDASSDRASRVDSEYRSGTQESMSEDDENDSDDEFGPPVRDSSAADSDDQDEETSDLTSVFRNLFEAGEPPSSLENVEDRPGTPRPGASSPLLPWGMEDLFSGADESTGQTPQSRTTDSERRTPFFPSLFTPMPMPSSSSTTTRPAPSETDPFLRPSPFARRQGFARRRPRPFPSSSEPGASPTDEQPNAGFGGGNGTGASGRASGGADLLFHLLLSLLSRVSSEDMGGSLFGDGPESYEEFLRLAELLGPARPRFARREDVERQLPIVVYRAADAAADEEAALVQKDEKGKGREETATLPDELKNEGDLDSAVLDPTVTVNQTQIPASAERDADTAPQTDETSSSEQTEDVAPVTWGIKDLLAATKEKCTICLSSYEEGESLRIMRCKHGFHAECIDQWLTSHVNSCPICRKPGTVPTRHPESRDPPPATPPTSLNSPNTEATPSQPFPMFPFPPPPFVSSQPPSPPRPTGATAAAPAAHHHHEDPRGRISFFPPPLFTLRTSFQLAERSPVQQATLGEINGLPVQGPLLPPGHQHPATGGGSDSGGRSLF